jgi:hypothetical protein
VDVVYSGNCTDVTSTDGCTATATFTGDTNHFGSSDAKSITITKALSSTVLTFETGPYVYRGSAFTATATVTGVGGLDESVDVVYSGNCTDVTDTDGCTATATFTGGTNHFGSTDAKSITITKANATIIVTPYDVTYNGAAHIATGSATGVLGESLAGLDLSDTTHTNASGFLGYIDTWTFTDVTGNYKDDFGYITNKIAKADAVINITGYTGIYDGNAYGASGTAVGVESTPADLNSLLHLGASFTNVPGGTAHWTFDGNENYNSTSGNIAITITKAPLTVTADNKSMIFGNPLPPFTFQYSGWVNGENASVVDTAPTCNVGLIPMFGNYPIVCSGGVDNNYNFKYVDGLLTVQAWNLKGFYQPVDMGKVNISKNGSTVPLKFEVFAGSTELTNINIVSTFIQKESCVTYTTDDIETYATGGTSLRYDTTGGQFIFNWQTPKIIGGCYKVTLTTQDGTSIFADFKLK